MSSHSQIALGHERRCTIPKSVCRLSRRKMYEGFAYLSTNVAFVLFFWIMSAFNTTLFSIGLLECQKIKRSLHDICKCVERLDHQLSTLTKHCGGKNFLNSGGSPSEGPWRRLDQTLKRISEKINSFERLEAESANRELAGETLGGGTKVQECRGK